MKTEFSLGEVHNRKQKRIRSLAEHDERLRQALHDACDAAGLADGIRSEIIEGGLHRFVIDSKDTVKGIGAFPDMNSYLETYRDTAPSPRQTAIELADERAMRKTELYEQMKLYAETGQAKAYRSARAEYAQL